MKNEYREVPDIITGKDLDYLTDMFSWNLSSYKKLKNTIEEVQDEDIKEIMDEAITMFHSHTEEILNILSEGGSNE